MTESSNALDFSIISPLFSFLGSGDEMAYKGVLPQNIMRFQATLKGTPTQIFVSPFVRKSEADVWDSCRQMLKESLSLAQTQVRGGYQFELLSIEMTKGLEIFQWGELTQLVVNHTRKMSVGEKRLIKYCLVYGLMTKCSDVEWGKIQLQCPVTVFDKEPSRLDGLIGKVIRVVTASNTSEMVQVILHDLSRESLLDSQNTEQADRLKALFNKSADDSSGLQISIKVMDKNGVHSLGIG